jgi:hypothetical protein
VEIVVHPVRTTADREAFVRFPEVIYEALPLWVPPLLSEERKRFDRAHHPFFEQGEAEWFLALQDGVVCGRICVAIDARFERSWNLRAAWFGAFECRNQSEVALALFDRAAVWARERGATEMRGPAYFSMNERGLLVGFDSMPPALMPYNRLLRGLIERAGLKAKDLVSYRTSQAPGERSSSGGPRASPRRIQHAWLQSSVQRGHR